MESTQFESGTRSRAFDRVLDEAPYLCRCSDNKTAAIIRPRDYAVRYPYMQVNRAGFVSWLVFDLDHSDSLIWEKEDLPTPNFVVTNRDSGHAHLYYAIIPVCTTENARSKPIQYMKAIYESMALRLKADLAYSGPVAKTPHHPWWQTWEIHNEIYELGELADSLELENKPRWSKGPDLEGNSHSRHCSLFEELRFFAYSIVNKHKEEGSYKTFLRCLESFAENKNNFRSRGFSANLTIAQVNATVKSVARWTWDFYSGNQKCNRGAMALPSDLPLDQRQSLSAKRTHEVRREETKKTISEAIEKLRDSDTPEAMHLITQKALAEETGFSRQTIGRYLPEILEGLTKPITQDQNPEAPQGDAKYVKYGLHQITGGLAVDNCEQLVIRKINNTIENNVMSFHSKEAMVDSKQGAIGAKSLFSRICSLLASIPKIDGVNSPFSYEFRARMARVILRFKLSELESTNVAISVAGMAVDPDKSNFNEDQWMGYLMQTLRQAKTQKLSEFQPLIGKFELKREGKDIFLSDWEVVLYQEYIEMSLKARQ